jgi:hypothetical protein
MPRYAERARAEQALREHISSHIEGRPDWAFSLAAGCVDVFRQSAQETETDAARRLLVPSQYWVIRNDDLRPYEVLWKAIGTIATSASAGTPFVAALILMVPEVARLCNVLANKRASLRVDQCKVLLAMKALGSPSSTADIAAYADLDSERTTAELLVGLTSLRCTDGTPISVVAQNDEGLWLCVGI